MHGTTAASGTNGPGVPEKRRAAARRRAVRRASVAAASGALTLAILGYAAFEVAGQLGGAAGAGPRASKSAAPVTLQPAAPATVTASAPTSAATAATSPTASPVTQPAQAAQPLTVVRAQAFGPHGLADGDNALIASRVLTGTALGWQSQWYATPFFGDLKQGTGLLLDLGGSYSVTAVKVTLGGLPGAVFQVRLGQAPELTALTAAGTGAARVSGDVLALPLSVPVKARYVLLWFTRLPPDGAGHYQASVRRVAVTGHPLR